MNSNELIPKEKFILLSPNEIQISLKNINSVTFGKTTYTIQLLIHSEKQDFSGGYTSQRSYSQFKDFFDKVKEKYPESKLPEFPSKLQRDEEKRIKYFDTLMNTIYELVKWNADKKQDLLSLIYDFILLNPEKERFELTPFMLKKIFKVPSKSVKGPAPQITSVASSMVESVKGKVAAAKEKIKESINLDNPSGWSVVSHTQERSASSGIISGIVPGLNDTSDEEDEQTKKPEWNVLMKSSMNKYTPVFIKIPEEDKCLEVYREEKNSNYFLLIPLYKINIDIFRIIKKPKEEKNENPTLLSKLSNYLGTTEIARYINPEELKALSEHDPNLKMSELDSEIEFRMYHDYDSFEFYIKFPSSTKISAIKSFYSTVTYVENFGSRYMSKIDKTNAFISGNLYVEVLKVIVPNYTGNCFVKINLEPYTFNTKVINRDTDFEMNQSFILPIHNRFISLKFIVFKSLSEGTIIRKNVEEKVAEFEINLPEFLNNFFPPDQVFERKDGDIQISFKLTDCSNLMGLMMKNKNKRILEDIPFENDDSDEKCYSMGMIGKRAKRLFVFIKDLELFVSMVLNFKYPLLSIFFLVLCDSYLLFCKTQYISTHICVFLLIVFIINCPLYQKYCSAKIENFLFSIRNPYDYDSEYFHTEEEIQEKKEMKKTEYLTAKNKKKKGFLSSLSVKKMKEYKKDLDTFIYLITKFVATLEKFKNLILWTDPKLSLYFCALVGIIFLVVYNIEFRYIYLFSLNKKFVKGVFYYKRKIQNNQAIAKIILRKCVKNLEKKDKNETDWTKTLIKDDKFKKDILKSFQENADTKINESIFKVKNRVDDLIEEVGKCEEMLVIKKTSKLYGYTKTDMNIFTPSLEPEDVFYYFIQNVKSDYYMAKHNLGIDEETKKEFLSTENQSDAKQQKVE